VGYTSFGHDFQELGVAASSGVLDPVLKTRKHRLAVQINC